MISFRVEMAVNMHQSLSVFSEACDSMNYRIVGMFGGEKVWRIASDLPN